MSEVLQVNWIHPKPVEKWLRSMVIGTSLNVCCGKSFVGDVRVDVDRNTNRTEEGDLFKLRFPYLSFDTVICDPPFSYYNKFGWIRRLSYLARKRLLISPDRTIIRLPRSLWSSRLYAFQMQRSATASYLRLYYCFDRLNKSFDSEVLSKLKEGEGGP